MPALQLHLDCKLSGILDLRFGGEFAAAGALWHRQSGGAVWSVSLAAGVCQPPGAQGKHLRLEAEKKGRRLRIVQFGVKPEDFPYVPGDFIDCAVQISKDPYKGKVYLSVRAADVRRSGTDDDQVF